MPGKKGFGDTRKKSSQSPAYKKQKFGARSPFIMKSALKQAGYPGTAQGQFAGAHQQPGIGSIHTLGLRNQAKKIRA